MRQAVLIESAQQQVVHVVHLSDQLRQEFLICMAGQFVCRDLLRRYRGAGHGLCVHDDRDALYPGPRRRPRAMMAGNDAYRPLAVRLRTIRQRFQHSSQFDVLGQRVELTWLHDLRVQVLLLQINDINPI